MKKRKLQFLCGAIAMIGFTACSDTDNMSGDVAQDGSYVYNVEVSAGTNSTTHAATRTLKLDEQNNVLSRWAAGDKIFIYNTADDNASTEQIYSTLTSQSGGSKGTSFQGTVKSKNKLKINNKFAFFYPAAGLEEGSVGLVSTSETEETNKGVTISYHDVSNTITEYVSLNMNRQNGTLEDIDKKFDFNRGSDLLKEVPQNVNNIKLKANFERKVAIWGMKFKIVNGPSSSSFIEDIDSVKINGLRSYDVLNLKNGSFVGTNDEKEYAITIANKDRSKLNLTKGYIWTAFLAEDASTNFTITVYTPSGVYTKTASKVFNTGYDYRSNITVEKITPQPYVTVNNVKWATGNFIHYKQGTKKNGLGSQNWYIDNHNGRYTQTSDDLDLFRWGDISEALNLNSNAYLGGTGFSIDEKYYKNKLTPGGLFNGPVDKSEAKFGDIVKYHTEKTGRSYYYKYPTAEQFEDLMKSVTKVPAFCYTDKGNKIYGIYYSDYALTGQHAKFPTGKKLWKYEDVTGLVLANRGLFLPITGQRNDNVSTTVYRHVAEGSNFMGFYYADRATAVSTCRGLFFGSLNYGMTLPQKHQACAIRPVYVGSAITGTPPVTDAAKFAPFSNIIDANGRKY